MITQKPISARIQHETLWHMNQYRMASGTSINSMLNDGARMYLDNIGSRRLFGQYTNYTLRRKIVRGYLKKWFPEALEVF